MQIRECSAETVKDTIQELLRSCDLEYVRSLSPPEAVEQVIHELLSLGLLPVDESRKALVETEVSALDSWIQAEIQRLTAKGA